AFAEGLYHGEGTLSLGNGITVKAAFEQGEVRGVARFLQNGKVYYEGDAANLLPEGMGTLYGSDGKALYTGPMRSGAVDGGKLLGLSANDIRELLGDKATETATDRGFAITSDALGLTAFCSFAKDDEEPTVYRLYLYQPADKIPSQLWQSAAAFEQAAAAGEEKLTVGEAGEGIPSFLVELPVKLPQQAFRRPYLYEGYTLRLWSKDKGSAPLLAEWSLDASLPEAANPAASDGSSGRLDALLGQLGLLQGAGSGGAAAQNPYYGRGDVNNLLTAVPAENRSAVAAAALTYFEQSERRVAAEENLELCRRLLEEARKQVDLGKGDELLLAGLEDTAARLELEIMTYTVQMRKDARTIEDAAMLPVQDFNLQTLPMLFDVTALDAAALGEAAIAVARAAAAAAQPDDPPAASRNDDTQPADTSAAETEPSESTDPTEPQSQPVGSRLPVIRPALPADPPAEEPAEPDPVEPPAEPEPEPPAVPVVDTKAVLQQVEDSLLELELTSQSVSLALREYETASAAAAQAGKDYSMGTVTLAEWYEAKMTVNELRAALYTATADFARRALTLNELTGGKLAADTGWMPELLGAAPAQ
ncbi:MAG: hypothetical protein IJC43_00150, partial [Clostridia bacterium]|nr:hypothetical protein [Clostridia bacterium]